MTSSFKVKDYPLLSEAQLTGQEQIFISATGSSPQPFNLTISTLQGYLTIPTGTVSNGSNAGLLGEGIFFGKFGSILEFKNIAAFSNKVLVGHDNLNNTVTVDIVPSNIPINQLSGTLLSSQFGVIDIVNGGTGASTAPSALSNLGAMPTSGGIFTGNVNGVTPIELSYVAGATSNLQAQINVLVSGVRQKAEAFIISLTDINISSPGTIIDGQTMSPGDSVVLNGQTAAQENGVYVWVNPTTAMTRRSDCVDGGNDATGVLGMSINITDGTNANTTWYLSTDAPITIGVTPLEYIKTSNNAYTGSNGIILTGNNFTLDYFFFSGAFTLDSMGVATITTNYVTNGMLAGSISASKLIGTDINTVGTVSLGTWHADAIDSQRGGLGIDTSSSTGYPQVLTGTWSIKTGSQLKTDLALNNVENTALSTWPGSTNLTTLGNVTIGTWSATIISTTYGGLGINTSGSTGYPEVSSGTWSIKTASQLKTDLSLNNVENTALSTWPGSANLTTLGTIIDGIWNGTILGTVYGGLGIDTSTSTGYPEVSSGTWSIKTSTQLKTDLSLNNVENTALSTWPGTINITTLGVITSGAWSGTNISLSKVGSGTQTGTGNIVLNNSPTLTTPNLGDATANTVNKVSITQPVTTATLTLANNSTFSTSGAFSTTFTFSNTTTVTFPTTGTLATLAGAEILSNKTFVSPILGTPASGNLSNCNNLPISTGVSGLGTGIATFLGNPSSSNLASALTDETGTGSVVFSNSPTLVTPSLGVSNSTSETINGTAGAGFLELQTQSSSPASGTTNSVRLFSDTTGRLSWKRQTDGFVRSFSSTLTADRVYTLPDQAGTFTLLGNSTTGSGNIVLANSPTLVTPIIGVSTATSISNGDGTVGAPSYTFTSGTANGFYVSGTNKTGVASNGVQVAEFNTTGLFVQNNIVSKITETTLSGSVTATGAQLFGGIISMTGGGGVTLTLDTAANIYAAMGSPGVVGAHFTCFIVSTGGTNTTIATNTGLTLVLGAATINNDGRNYHFVVTNTSTPTITVYGG